MYVFPCVILFLCFSVLLVLRLPRLGKRELILVLFVRLFGLCLFRFVGFLFLFGVWEGLGFVIVALPGLFSYFFVIVALPGLLYIDEVLSLNNTKFAEYLEFIYPRELEIKETTETAASSSYLDCYLYIDNGMLTTRLYDRRDDFNFPIVNFPFLSSNIPSAPAYGVYVSQLIRNARDCSNDQDFMERGKVLTTKLLSQGIKKPNW